MLCRSLSRSYNQSLSLQQSKRRMTCSRQPQITQDLPMQSLDSAFQWLP